MESLTLPLHTASSCEVLVGSLPEMKHLRKLDIAVQSGPPCGYNAMLLQAVKRNCSLWQFTVSHGEDWLEADTAHMKFYSKRNKQIHAILELPTNIVKLLRVWPRVFRAVRGCEMEAAVILAVLTAPGESVGHPPENAEKRQSESPDSENGGNEIVPAGLNRGTLPLTSTSPRIR